MTDDSDFFPKLVAISQCLCAEITVRGLPETCFCGVIHGAAIPADYCESGLQGNGMAWARLVSITEVQSQGQDPQASFCGSPLEAVIEVGILRCALGLSESGMPPTVEQHMEAARLAAADMAASLAAIRCCVNKRDVRVLAWQPMGPDGGCVGGAWTAVVQSG
jgi:hypothetical protein